MKKIIERGRTGKKETKEERKGHGMWREKIKHRRKEEGRKKENLLRRKSKVEEKERRAGNGSVPRRGTGNEKCGDKEREMKMR